MHMSSFISSILGDNNLSTFDKRVDDLLGSIPSVSDNTPVDDESGRFIDNIMSYSDDSLEIGNLFENISVPRERMARYTTYEELYRTVPIIKRILRVYKANVLQKNPATGDCLIYRETDTNKDQQDYQAKIDKSKKFAKDVVRNYKLIHKLQNLIIPNQHLYGDCFVEIVDIPKEAETVKLDQQPTYLSESINASIQIMENIIEKQNNYSFTEKTLDTICECIGNLVVQEDDLPIYESIDLRENREHLLFNEEKIADKKEKETPLSSLLMNVLIKVHSPKRIIILETNYGTRIGYLEVAPNVSGEVTNIGSTLSNVMGKLNTLSTKNSIPQDVLVNKLIYHVIRKILEKSKSKNAKDIETTIKSLGDDTYLFIKRMFIEQGIGKSNKNSSIQIKPMKTRFIPANRMISFNIPSSDNYPYGESIVDPLIFPSKMYVLSQLS